MFKSFVGNKSMEEMMAEKKMSPKLKDYILAGSW